MRVYSVHERVLPVAPELVGSLIDGLASDADRLWPRDRWPAMCFDRPLSVGAAGGHGPIRYVVESYEPGHFVRFRFTAPSGLVGTHCFELTEPVPVTRLRHVLEAETRGLALLSWLLVYRPLHDALLEDCMDCAAAALGFARRQDGWPVWVWILRWGLSLRNGGR